MTQDDIFNYGELSEKLNCSKDMDNKPFLVSHVRETKFGGLNPGIVYFKCDYDEENRQLSTKKRGHPVNFCTYVPRKAYHRDLGVSKEKLED